MRKYIVGQGNQKHLIVEPKVHRIIKLYAREKGISMSEAVYRLLSKAFAMEEDLEMSDKWK